MLVNFEFLQRRNLLLVSLLDFRDIGHLLGRVENSELEVEMFCRSLMMS